MPKMFVISHPPQKNKFIVRTETKTQKIASTPFPQKPKLNSHFATSTSSNTSVTNHVLKAVHMSQPIINNNKQFIKKKLKFRFSVVKNYPQIEKRSKKAKDSKKYHRRINKDQHYACGRWKVDEHKRFVDAIITYGNDWKQVQKCVKTRSSTQARSHAQKFFVKIKNAKLLQFNLDLSKASIKMLHDLVSNMSSEEYDKMITALNNVAFERRTDKRNTLDNKSSDDEEAEEEDDEFNDDNSFIDLNLNKPNDIFNLNPDIHLKSSIFNQNSTNIPSWSIGFNNKAHIPLLSKKNSVNSQEGFYNININNNNNNNNEDKEKEFNFGYINDKEYISSFNKTFTMEMDNNKINITNEELPRSRRMSIEDDFIYNYMKQNF